MLRPSLLLCLRPRLHLHLRQIMHIWPWMHNLQPGRPNTSHSLQSNFNLHLPKGATLSTLGIGGLDRSLPVFQLLAPLSLPISTNKLLHESVCPRCSQIIMA